MQNQRINYEQLEVEKNLKDRIHQKSRPVFRHQEEERQLVAADYRRVVTTIKPYANVLVHLKHSKSIHSLNDEPCDRNLKCNAVHYGACVKLLLPRQVPQQEPPNLTSQLQYSEEKKTKDVQTSTEEHLDNYFEDNFQENPEYFYIGSNFCESLDNQTSKTATKTAKPLSSSPSSSSLKHKKLNLPQESSSSSSISRSKSCISPTLSDTAAIQLLAEDVDGKLENLLKTFVSEEKQRQEAKLNRNLYRRSTSLLALNSIKSGNGSNSAPGSPCSPNTNSREFFSKSKNDFEKISKEKKGISSPKESQKRQSESSSESSRKKEPRKVAKVSKEHRRDAPNLEKRTLSVENLIINPIRNANSIVKTAAAAINSSQPVKQFKCSNKMVYGLSDKSPKYKYLELLSKRKSTSLESLTDYSGRTTSKSPTLLAKDSGNLKSSSPTHSSSTSLNQQSNKKLDLKSKTSSSPSLANNNNNLRMNNMNSIKRSDSSEMGLNAVKQKKIINNYKGNEIKKDKTMEQILNEVLQLTDDEKACLLKKSSNQELNRELKAAPIVQSNHKTLETGPKSTSKKSVSHHLGHKSGSIPNKAKENKVQQSVVQQRTKDNQVLTPITIDTGTSRQKSPSPSSPTPYNELEPHEINYQSAVDYAKTRFINNSIQNSNENNNSNKNNNDKPTQNLVNEAKIKWERSTVIASQLQNHAELNGIPNTGQHKFNQKGGYSAHNHGQAKDRFHPIKPFLTKGSVAERVLLFERCPSHRRDKNNQPFGGIERFNESFSTYNNPSKRSKSPVLYSTWRNQNESEVANLARSFGGQLNGRRSSFRASWGIGVGIPRFHYPKGRPYTSLDIETQLRRIAVEFEKMPGKRASRDNFGFIIKACGLPLYWKEPLFIAVTGPAGMNRKATVTCDVFFNFWKRVISNCYDEASRFVKILSKGQRNFLIPEDFVPMIQDVIETHPGLNFLKEAFEFHSRYVHTVIARIYYNVNKSWSGRLTIPELRKSNFLAVVSILEEEEDINQITDYFSYEHFYVIYCKFWELDKDHDLIIDKYDLSRHNEGAISSRMIERIFSGAVTRGPSRGKQGQMTYSEFVWFLMSEEDKRHPRSIEYWFRCMDLDGDGYLSMYELEYFYEEQVRRMEALGIEALNYTDCLCQMLDMISPKRRDLISLSDLKHCRMTPIFFDTFFNLDKYLDHEQRDPFASRDQDDGFSMTDWDRYAAEEYEILVAEESASGTHMTIFDCNGIMVAEPSYSALFGGMPTDFAIAAKKYGLNPQHFIDHNEDCD